MSSAATPTEAVLALRIKTERNAAILTQKELAEQFGVSERTLQGWEAGTAFPQPRHRRLVLAWLAEREEVAA